MKVLWENTVVISATPRKCPLTAQNFPLFQLQPLRDPGQGAQDHCREVGNKFFLGLLREPPQDPKDQTCDGDTSDFQVISACTEPEKPNLHRNLD